MRILCVTPIGTDVYNADRADLLARIARPGTEIEFVSLPEDRPKHVEYHSYEALALPDIVRHVRAAAGKFDAVIITCFYDLGLREAREISGRTVVVGPCQASLAIATQLGNSFSILVGRRKWVPKMRDNVRLYGLDHAMASMRPVGLGVHDFQTHDETCSRLLEVGRACVEDDGAEVLILGCGALYGFNKVMQDELGVPVIDALQAAFKQAEFLADTALTLGWTPSRKWGSEPPPEDQIRAWGLFRDPPPVGTRTVPRPRPKAAE